MVWSRTVVWLLGLLLLPVATAFAAEAEILSPQPGAKLMLRNPMVHLLVRVENDAILKVKALDSGEIVPPRVQMEGDGGVYLHYRLPLKLGKNRFALIPGGQSFTLDYKKIQADLTLRSLDKAAYLFHSESELRSPCSDCHDMLESELVQPVSIRRQTGCATCHQTILEKGRFKHGPTINQECLRCHLQSEEPLKIGFPLIGTKALCLTCHQQEKEWLEKKVTHGPLRLGGCTLCHDPHGEDNKGQLWADGRRDLCLVCHSDMSKLVSPESPVPYVHGIIFGSGCLACHDAHATDQLFVLKKTINELCLGCHRLKLVNGRGHPVARHPVSGPRDFLRPGRRHACTSCHDPHGTAHRYFLIETKQGGKICRDCHRR